MADDRAGRDRQADDERRRQRQRAIETGLRRRNEAEPPVAPDVLADVETAVDRNSYLASAAAVVDAAGDREIETAEGTYALAELLPDPPEPTFDSPAAVRGRVERPTIAAATARIVEASRALDTPGVYGSQRDAYERTFRGLRAIDSRLRLRPTPVT